MSTPLDTHEFSQKSGVTLDELVELASQRLEKGEPIDIEALCAAHAEHATALRELLPAVAMLFKLGANTIDAGNGAAAAPPVTRLGDFRLIREIGRGGMGVIYEAEQVSLHRKVALKVLPFASVLDKQQLARFANEARAAATLDHPNIVAVHSVGSDRGVHFFAMQLIDSQSLAEVIEEVRGQALGNRIGKPETDDNHGVSTSQSANGNPKSDIVSGSSGLRRYYHRVAELGIQAARALEHAHSNGILHRDIKPANLLLDRHGKLWVTDFGLARICSEAGLTTSGDLLGTLRYMSPEQVSANSGVVDHRSDIYSLGATLYELLALHPAFDGDDRPELIRRIVTEEPCRLRRQDQRIPTDLETIVAKAMDKNPSARYATAGELADDLQRFVAHQPIRARPATYFDRMIKWSRRHHSLVAATGLALLLLSVVLLFSVATINRARVEAVAALSETASLLYMADMALAYQAWEAGWADEVSKILDRQVPAPGERDRRGLEWHLLRSLMFTPQPMELKGHKGAVNELVVLPDGSQLATVGDDGTLRFWDTLNGTLLNTIRLGADPLYSVAASPDGRYVIAGSRIIHLCDLQNNCSIHKLFQLPDNFESLAFSPDGKRIAAGSRYAEACILTLEGDVLHRISSGARMTSIEFLPHSDQLLVPNRPPEASMSRKGLIQIWPEDYSKPERKFGSPQRGNSGPTMAKSSPDETYLATGQRYGSNVCFFHLASGRLVGKTPAFRDELTDLAYSPCGKLLATTYRNGAVELFNLRSSGDKPIFIERIGVFTAHAGEIECIRFLTSTKFATCGADGYTRVWNLEEAVPSSARAAAEVWTGPQLMPWKKEHASGTPLGIQLSPDGSRLVYLWEKQTLLLGTATGDLIEVASVCPVKGGATFCPSDGRIGYCYLERSDAEITDAAGKGLFLVPHGSPANAIAFSPTGERLAVIGDRVLQVCNGIDGHEIFRKSLPGRGLAVAFSQSGNRLAHGGAFEGITLIDAKGRENAIGPAGGLDTRCLVFSPDDTRIAAGQAGGVIRILDTKTGLMLGELMGHEKAVYDIVFSPDGRTLISASDDGTVRLWSAEHYRSFGVLYRSSEEWNSNHSISISADGRSFALSRLIPYCDPEVLIWRYRRKESLSPAPPG